MGATLTKRAPTCLSDDLRVDAIVSIDRRGQMVVPKAIRDELGMGPDSKLALITRRTEGRPCCLLLVKAEDLSDHVKGILGPMMNME